MESTDSSAECRKPHLPRGFRFHPTDEELVVHYLKKKAAAAPLPVAIIAEVDLYKFDPWELPAKAVFGEQEWYFFSPRDRRYPNGARPNRAATSGYWKATGTDKPVLTAGGTQKAGVKKALVFYRGKPPKGIKTNWIMHEYRLVDHKAPPLGPPSYPARNGSLRLDDWVLCRIYKRNNNNNDTSPHRPLDHERYTTIETSLDLVPKSNYNSFLETEHDFYDHQRGMSENIGTVPNGTHLCSAVSKSPPSPQFPFMAVDPTILPDKRTLHNLYLDGEDRTRRFDVVQNSDPDGNNSIANILSQLSESPGLRPHVPIGNNNGGEGTFRHPYQVSGVNWYN